MDAADQAPPAKRQRTVDEGGALRHTVTVRTTLPARSDAEKALAAWRLRQLRAVDAEAAGGSVVDEAPTADGGAIAVAVGPIELVAFPMGNYRADVDWLLQDGGTAKLEQSQAASAAITRLVRRFACLQVGLDEAPEVTAEALAAALAFLRAELEALPQQQQQQPQQQRASPPSSSGSVPGGSAAGGSPAASSGGPAAECCPAGHKLVATTSTEPVGCDVCEEVLMDGGRIHSCSKCDYDCCSKCFAQGKAGTTAVAEDSAEEDGELWKCTDGELWRGMEGGGLMPAAAEGETEGGGNASASGGGGGVERLLRDACTAIEELACAAAPLSDLHRKIYLSGGQILTTNECEAAVRAAEDHAAMHGWATARHAAYPTHDLPIEALAKGDARPKAESRVITDCVSTAIEEKLIPQMAERFELQADALSVLDLFIARYSVEPGGLAALEPHEDGSEFSFVLALNDLTEYEGGGTQFLATGEVPHPVFRPEKGFATMFSGKNRHCGLPITAGVRFILAGFLRYRPTAVVPPP
jgi:hypothetical protein